MLGNEPDAVNFWMGDTRAVTSSKSKATPIIFPSNVIKYCYFSALLGSIIINGQLVKVLFQRIMKTV